MRLLAFFMIIADFFILFFLLFLALQAAAFHDDHHGGALSAEGYSNDLGEEEVIRTPRERRPWSSSSSSWSLVEEKEPSIQTDHHNHPHNRRHYHHHNRLHHHHHHHHHHHQQHPQHRTRPIASHRHHHHSSKLRDDEVVSTDRDSSSAKTNPLIEWPPLEAAYVSLATVANEYPTPRKHQAEHEQQQQQQHLDEYESSLSLTPLFDKGARSRRASPKADHWCHRDCSGGRGGLYRRRRRNSMICASDGYLYGSFCELRRQACRRNVHLFRLPNENCRPSPSNGTTMSGSRTQQLEASSSSSSYEYPRVVELRRACTRLDLEDLKQLLLRQFNGDTRALFSHLDANSDGLIEAHELWPRRNESSNKLLYAQVWDKHLDACESAGFDTNERRVHLAERSSKCWFLLDFAFEPHFESNPCSLSHLLLFEFSHPNNEFTLDSFEKIFRDAKAKIYNNNNSNNNSENRINNKANSESLALKRFTSLNIELGDSVSLRCLEDTINDSSKDNEVESLVDDGLGKEERMSLNNIRNTDSVKCLWTRHNVSLNSIQDPHISIEERRISAQEAMQEAANSNKNSLLDFTLHLKNAQLYLSGHYKCTCKSESNAHNLEHTYQIQVLAKPRVNVRPKSQWSLPNSRISFECHYDHIDTSLPTTTIGGHVSCANDSFRDYPASERDCSFGLQVEWLKDNREPIVDSKRLEDLEFVASQQTTTSTATTSTNSQPAAYVSSAADDSFYLPTDSNNDELVETSSSLVGAAPQQPLPSAATTARFASSSSRASITMASSRLTLESLQLNDTGSYSCKVKASHALPIELSNQAEANLLVQDRPPVVDDQSSASPSSSSPSIDISNGSGGRTYLWMFHDNGISIYKLQNDDGQEMELEREINGHSLVSAEVDGNWNQLTLCGGLNPEQVVICEWSDNALFIDVNFANSYQDEQHEYNDNHAAHTSPPRKYVYVGQPNLNRIIVMDAFRFEIVAIVNTEPQPRRLYLYKPNKIHLSKWVRHRLSPKTNARWLSAIGAYAHSLKSTPADSNSYSSRPFPVQQDEGSATIAAGALPASSSNARARRFSTNQKPSPLIQHDIWLLCYGQPLVVDPSGDEHLEDSGGGGFVQQQQSPSVAAAAFISSKSAPANDTHYSNPRKLSSSASLASAAAAAATAAAVAANTIQPFTPRLSSPVSTLAWSLWLNKESRLRNRKSVHIIQSTFFPKLRPTSSSTAHSHPLDEAFNQAATPEDHQAETLRRPIEHNSNNNNNNSVVSEFKKSTVLTTHHVFATMQRHKSTRRYLNRVQVDLIQDLHVPAKPYSLEGDKRHNIHYSYVTHYDDRRLFRISMDEYRYDRDIDLQNCDPINLMTTAQGLLIVQCRAPITHKLIGQLVLDQLTSARIEFNANVQAQESYLTPDHRYLISILNNSTITAHQTVAPQDQHNRAGATADDEQSKSEHSVIYVQTVSVTGLKLQYEIKTSLEISQCTFVWKDGYYAAIFISTNHRDQQSEILSLRLADSRLELMARVPGIVSLTRHKNQLVISHELKLAALSTNQGTYVVDLEDNRVSQSLRHHQSTPTLLWV